MAMSIRRKLMIATWGPPDEGNIHGKLVIDATELVKYIAWIREKSGIKVTIGTVVGRAVGQALREAPGLNGHLRFNTYVPHDTVDIAFLVALQDGKNLAKAKICDIDKKTPVQITEELHALADRLYKGKDENFKKSMAPLSWMPVWLIRRVVWFTGILTSSLGLSIPALGLEAFPFGTCIITNVGVFGLDEAYVPPTPFARVPVYIMIGAMHDAVAPVNGVPTVRKEIILTATIDHRFIDGAQGGVLAKVVRRVLENPWQLEGMQGPPADA